MNKADIFKKPLFLFIVSTYLLFWALLMVTGVVIMRNPPKVVQEILIIICAWAPNFAFFILFKKLYPDLTLREYLKQRFCTAIRIPVLVILPAVHIFIILATVSSYSFINSIPVLSIIDTSLKDIVLIFFIRLIQGPLGEEFGWNYVLVKLQKTFPPISSAVILGVVWGFWHTPLWFLTTDYSGVDLIKYIILFMICIISTAIIITTFYNLNQNLVLPMIIHLLFNFSIDVINLDVLQTMCYIAPFYLLTVLVLLVSNPKKVLFGVRPII